MSRDTVQVIFIVAVSVAAAVLFGFYAATLRNELDETRAQLEVLKESLRLEQAARDADAKAHAVQKQEKEAADAVTAKRYELLDHLPAGWGDSALPDDILRVFEYGAGSDSADGAGSPSGGSYAGHAGAAVDAADK